MIAAALTISQWLGFENLTCHGQRYFNCLQIQISILQLSKWSGGKGSKKKISNLLYVHWPTSQ